MNKLQISDFSISSLENPSFVKPVRLHYIQNSVQKTWEAVQARDSVAVMLYHRSKKAFLLVKQFRAPVYAHHNEFSFTYELCAGLIDKECSLEQIVKEEIDEECGYDVDIKDIKRINSFFTNVGISGTKQHLYFAFIDDDLKVGEGGGIHDEQIELHYLAIKEAKEFIFDESKAKTPGLMFAFYWFFENYKEELGDG